MHQTFKKIHFIQILYLHIITEVFELYVYDIDYTMYQLFTAQTGPELTESPNSEACIIAKVWHVNLYCGAVLAMNPVSLLRYDM